MLTLERHPDGGWLVKCPATGEQRRIGGRKGSLMSMLLATLDYRLRDDFHPFEPFTAESLERGQPAEPESVTVTQETL